MRNPTHKKNRGNKENPQAEWKQKNVWTAWDCEVDRTKSKRAVEDFIDYVNWQTGYRWGKKRLWKLNIQGVTWAWNKHTTYVVIFYRQITQFIKYDASLVDSGSHVYIKHLKRISLPRVAAVKHFNVNASVILLQSHIKNEINTDRLTDYECWCIFDALHIKDGL